MRKAILIVLLAAMSSNAMAEWEAVGGNETSTFYVNPTPIRNRGDKVEMWVMINYATIQEMAGFNPMSLKVKNEFDCKKEQIRTLGYTLYSGKMGGGNAVFVDSDPMNSRPVMPDSAEEVFWKFACGKK
ncbi:MAG: surface-adhesin E family protein [Gallionellaceae bacterium]